MRFLMSFLMVAFAGAVVALALTFGVAMIIWLVLLAVAFSGATLLREQFRRWRGGVEPMPPQGLRDDERRPPYVIDAEYKDVSANEKEKL